MTPTALIVLLVAFFLLGAASVVPIARTEIRRLGRELAYAERHADQLRAFLADERAIFANCPRCLAAFTAMVNARVRVVASQGTVDATGGLPLRHGGPS